jgi:hypothetical protein
VEEKSEVKIEKEEAPKVEKGSELVKKKEEEEKENSDDSEFVFDVIYMIDKEWIGKLAA